MRTFSIKGGLQVLAGALCFSTVGFTQALIIDDGATPYSIMTLRMFVGGLGLLALCAIRGTLPTLHHWPIKNFLLAAMGVVCYQLFFFQGLPLVGVVVGTLVMSSSVPVLVAVFGRIFLRTSPPPEWYFSTVLAITGLVFISWGKAGDFAPAGLLLPLGAGASYAVYLTFSGPLLRYHSADAVMALILLSSSLCLLPGLVTEDLSWVMTPKGAIAILHLGLVTQALGYVFTLYGLRQVSPAVAATLGQAEPVCAALLGCFCLGENIPLMSFIGIVLILGSTSLLFIIPVFLTGRASFHDSNRPLRSKTE